MELGKQSANEDTEDNVKVHVRPSLLNDSASSLDAGSKKKKELADENLHARSLA